MEKKEKVVPKYSPGNIINIEVKIIESRVGKDHRTSEKYVAYQVCPSDEDSHINSMVIWEKMIQD